MTDISELKQKAEEEKEELDEQEEELQDFETWVEEDASNLYSNMEEREKEKFSKESEKLLTKLEGISTADELIEFQEEVETAVKQPIKNVAKSDLETLLEHIDNPLSEDHKEIVEEHIDSTTETDSNGEETLRDIADAYREAIDLIGEEDFQESSTLLDIVRKKIQDNYQILQTPKENLLPFLESLKNRKNNLSEVGEKFEEVGEWTPEFDPETESYYTNLNEEIDIEQIRNHVNSIDEKIGELKEYDLKISDVVSSDLSDIDEEKAVDLSDKLHEISVNITNIKSDHSELIEDLEKVSEKDEYPSDLEVGDLTDEYEELDSLEGVSEVESELSEIGDQVDDLISKIGEEIENMQERVEKITTHFEVQEQDIDTDGVDDKLYDGLSVYQEYDKYLSELYEEISEKFQSPETSKLYKKLYKRERVEVSESEMDALEELSEKVPLEISLK